MRSNRLVVWNACALSALTGLAGQALGQGRIAVEEIMREIAIRRNPDRVEGQWGVSWPACHGTSASEMPEDNWYQDVSASDMEDLVSACNSEFFEGNGLFSTYLTPDGRDLSGEEYDDPNLEFYYRTWDEQTETWDSNLPWAGLPSGQAVNSSNYQTVASGLKSNLAVLDWTSNGDGSLSHDTRCIAGGHSFGVNPPYSTCELARDDAILEAKATTPWTNGWGTSGCASVPDVSESYDGNTNAQDEWTVGVGVTITESIVEGTNDESSATMHVWASAEIINENPGAVESGLSLDSWKEILTIAADGTDDVTIPPSVSSDFASLLGHPCVDLGHDFGNFIGWSWVSHRLIHEWDYDTSAIAADDCLEDKEIPFNPNDENGSPDGEGNGGNGSCAVGGGGPGGGGSPQAPGFGGGGSGGGDGAGAIGNFFDPIYTLPGFGEGLGYNTNPGSLPVGPYPISLAYGYKLETVTDIHVPLLGPDFTITRSYSSQGDLTGSGLVGEHWTLSPFVFMTEDGGSGDLRLYVPSQDRKITYAETSPGSGRFETGGPTAQYFEETTVTIDGTTINGTTINVWRLTEPGFWHRDFYRPDGGTNTPAELVGLLLEERDVHGRGARYTYTIYGTTTTRGRLNSVYLNGTPEDDDAQATVHFNWHVEDDPGADNVDDAFEGRVSSIYVTRPDANGFGVVTQRVEYTYQAAGVTDDRGTEGDLIQVTKYTLVDSAEAGEPYWGRVTQYRYHDDTAAGTAGDERLNGAGELNQLKAVFMPEQIEYYAQKLNSGGAVNPEDALLTGASNLLTKADNANLSATLGTGFTTVDVASKIIHYYDSGADDDKVSAQYIQSACGCGGGGGNTQGLKQGFVYIINSSDRTTEITEYIYDGSDYTSVHRTIHCDMSPRKNGETIPYLDTVAIIEPGGTPRQWVWGYAYDEDEGTLIKRYMPSVKKTYTAASVGTAAAYSREANTGLVYGYQYTSDNRLKEVRVREGVGQGIEEEPAVTFYELLGRIAYPSSNDTDSRTYLPETIELFNVSKTGTTPTYNADEVETYTYTYGFHSSGNSATDFAWAKLASEAELEAENGQSGSGNTYSRYLLIDTVGILRWQRAEDKALVYRDHDPSTGAISLVVRNADPSTSGIAPQLLGTSYGGITVTGWGRVADGGELATTYVHDLLGRTIQRIAPGTVNSYTVRTLRSLAERDEILYYASVSLPHELTDGSFDGPATIAWINGGGSTMGVSDYEIDDTQSYDPTALIYTLLQTTAGYGKLGLSTVQHELSGLVSSRTRWHDVVGNKSYVSEYTYDSLGRVLSMTDPVDTITEYTDYDVLDRVLSIEVGTDDTGGMNDDMVEVTEYFYDSAGTATQGWGNGNLTFVRQHTGESTEDERDTESEYDYRDRPIKSINPLAPHSLTVYDNLNRPIQSALFQGTTVPDDIDDSGELANRGLYTETDYSQRGLAYREGVAIAPTEANPTTSGLLESHYWFDENGRTIAEWMPNSAGSKRSYDGLSRVTTAYVTDRKLDDDPGAVGNYVDAGSVTDDQVLEQMTYKYTDQNRVELATSIYRSHDDTTAGVLDSTDEVATYVGFVYDDAQRRIGTINYGTNQATDMFRKGGSEPTVPTTLPGTPDADEIQTSQTFNIRGLVDEAKDPEGFDTKFFYDDLNRRIAVVGNYEDATVTWSTDRWSVGNITDANPDTDRATTFVYDGNNNLTKQVAHIPSGTTETIQITEYVRGTIQEDNTDAEHTLIASNSLLKEVVYPDETTGNPGTGDEYRVKFFYNQLGEARTVKDQNGTRHEYDRDVLGRVTKDRVTAFGASVDGETMVVTDIDDRIKRIQVGYDSLGRVDSVASHTNATTDAFANEVEVTYTDLWQIDDVFQDINGAVTRSGTNPTGDTEVVRYAYSDAKMASGNYSRPSTVTYPAGSVVTMVYGTNDLNDRISRVTAMDNPDFGLSDEIVRYEFVGLGMVGVVDYPVPDVLMDRSYKHDGSHRGSGATSGVTGEYPGWDRFGRVTRHSWIDGNITTGTGGLPNQPPLLEQTHSYDPSSNRADRYDGRPGAKRANRDFEFDYDDLDRLIEQRRGYYDATPTWQRAAAASSVSWTCWATGMSCARTPTSADRHDIAMTRFGSGHDAIGSSE